MMSININSMVLCGDVLVLLSVTSEIDTLRKLRVVLSAMFW